MVTVTQIKGALSLAPQFARGGSGLVWLTGPRCGQMAGTKTNHGYYQVKFKGERLYAHQLVAMLTDLKDWRLPRREPLRFCIDHLNGKRDDNRPNNLRVVTYRQNAANQKCYREGKLIGAWFEKRTGKWRSQIRVKGCRISLGVFPTEKAAHCAYVKKLGELGMTLAS